MSEETRERPLHTPKKEEPQKVEEPQTNIVTIFDVATEIEQMLQDLANKVDENDQLLLSKVDKISKKLDKIEKSAKK